MPGVSPEERAGLRRHHVPGTFGEGGLGPMWGGLRVTTSHWAGWSRGSGPPRNVSTGEWGVLSAVEKKPFSDRATQEVTQRDVCEPRERCQTV